jgi:hypothetical protein
MTFKAARPVRAGLRIACAAAALLLFASGCSSNDDPPSNSAASSTSTTPQTTQVRHVFVILLENENGGVTFGRNSPAPYLAKTLTALGAYLPNYYGIGHNSLDNYIALISGQPPNIETQSDCGKFTDFVVQPGGTADIPAGRGCVYPADVATIAGQLDTAGFSWKGYMQDMGNDPTREAATCGHPAIGAVDNTQSAEPQDQYATRHDPFVYFHGIIDNAAYCSAHVVNLNLLDADLAQLDSTPNYVFITPNLCDDGHDSPCANGDPGGLPQADQFLQTWVPKILASPAYQQDGVLMVLFDESGSSASVCCAEPSGPNTPLPGIYGPGGGKTGAVLLSPFITPGTVSQTDYNHYSLLKSVEGWFGLDPLGYAAQKGLTGLGSDIFGSQLPTP